MWSTFGSEAVVYLVFSVLLSHLGVMRTHLLYGSAVYYIVLSAVYKPLRVKSLPKNTEK